MYDNLKKKRQQKTIFGRRATKKRTSVLVRYTLTYTPTLKTVFETFVIVNTIKENSQFYFLTLQRVKTTLCGQATTCKENSYKYDQTQKQFLKISDR